MAGLALTKGGGVVTGYAEIDAALAALEPKVQRKIASGALRAGSNRIAGAALERIKQNPSIDKGALLSSVKVRYGKRSRVRISADVIVKAPHANLVEYGTKRMPPEPFLRPAGYGQADLIERMLIEDISDAIKHPAWNFKKESAAFVTHSRRQAKKVITQQKRAKKKAAEARVKARNAERKARAKERAALKKKGSAK